jgi:hypothetical protein
MNAQAYFCAASVTEKKSFIALAPSLIFVPMAKDRGTGHRFVILHCKTIYCHKKIENYSHKNKQEQFESDERGQ